LAVSPAAPEISDWRLSNKSRSDFSPLYKKRWRRDDSAVVVLLAFQIFPYRAIARLLRTARMVARYKAQLAHQSVHQHDISERIHRELRSNERCVLELAGFYKVFGRPDAPGYTGKEEAVHLLNEITGCLATALTIHHDAGFKAPNKVIATLKAIIENPLLALSDKTEPEARGVVYANYQRTDEKPGTFWFDLEGYGRAPDDGQIRLAAERAIADLKAGIIRGRPIIWAVQYLTSRLREIFLRFNHRIMRKTVSSSKGDGEFYFIEVGDFFMFVEEVLAPLHRVLPELSNGGPIPKLSAEYITCLAAAGTDRLDGNGAHLTP
jgi:hypothetical protein